DQVYHLLDPFARATPEQASTALVVAVEDAIVVAVQSVEQSGLAGREFLAGNLAVPIGIGAHQELSCIALLRESRSGEEGGRSGRDEQGEKYAKRHVDESFSCGGSSCRVLSTASPQAFEPDGC